MTERSEEIAEALEGMRKTMTAPYFNTIFYYIRNLETALQEIRDKRDPDPWLCLNICREIAEKALSDDQS